MNFLQRIQESLPFDFITDQPQRLSLFFEVTTGHTNMVKAERRSGRTLGAFGASINYGSG